MADKKPRPMIDAGEIPIDVRERDRFGVPFPPQNGPAGDALLAQFDRFGKPLPSGGEDSLTRFLREREARKQQSGMMQAYGGGPTDPRASLALQKAGGVR